LSSLRSINAEAVIARHRWLMSLPFDIDQFLAVFSAYNAAIWPAQIVAYALGFAAVGALLTGHPARHRTILAVLSLLWAWNGLAYQLAFFSTINPAGKVFAALFIVQAALFAAHAVMASDLRFEIRPHWRSIAGLALIVFAVLVYEVLGVIAGHGLMQGPLFGVAPCPTTIFTIALLLLARGRSVVWLSLIPIVWALIGSKLVSPTPWAALPDWRPSECGQRRSRPGGSAGSWTWCLDHSDASPMTRTTPAMARAKSSGILSSTDALPPLGLTIPQSADQSGQGD
jgi:hypothetical protein